MDLNTNIFLRDIVVIVSDIYRGSIAESIVIEYQLQTMNVILLDAATQAIIGVGGHTESGRSRTVNVRDWSFSVISSETITEDSVSVEREQVGIGSFNVLAFSTYTIFEFVVVGVSGIILCACCLSLVFCIRSGIKCCCGETNTTNVVHVDLKEEQIGGDTFDSPSSMKGDFRVMRQRLSIITDQTSDSELDDLPAGSPCQSPQNFLKFVHVAHQ